MSVIISGESSAAAYLGAGELCCGEFAVADRLRALRAPESVLIVGEGAIFPHELSVFAAVVDADGGFDADGLNGIAVISCGMSGRNTVSMTSCSGDTMILSLNRSVMTLKGLCEPFEQPVRRLPDTSDYDCMAAFAAAVLLGVTGN